MKWFVAWSAMLIPTLIALDESHVTHLWMIPTVILSAFLSALVIDVPQPPKGE